MGRPALEPDRKKATPGVVTATEREEGRSRGAAGRRSGLDVISDGPGAEPHEAKPAEEQQAAGRLDDGGGAADSWVSGGERQSAVSQPPAVGHHRLTGPETLLGRPPELTRLGPWTRLWTDLTRASKPRLTQRWIQSKQRTSE